LGPFCRSCRQKDESGDEALVANTKAAKGEMAWSPVKPAKNVQPSVHGRLMMLAWVRLQMMKSIYVVQMTMVIGWAMVMARVL